MIREILKNCFLTEIVVGTRMPTMSDILVPSVFNIRRDFGDTSLVYNTFTKCLIEISKEIVDSAVQYLDEHTRNILYKLGILVNEEVDEQDRYLALHKVIRSLEYKSGLITRFNILTTTGCNAQCVYCFEKGVKPVHMTTETAVKVARHIIRCADTSIPCELRWFGGEPFLNPKVIDTVTDILGKNGLDFYSTSSTNGILLNRPEIWNNLEKWRFKKIRVSLDGLKNEHNRRKNLPSNEDAFGITMQNIDLMVDKGLSVSIRLTFDENNLNDILTLAQMLVNKYKGITNIKLYTRCVFDRMTTKAFIENPSQVQLLADFKESLDMYLFSNGLFEIEKWNPIGYQQSFCAANNPVSVVLDPLGRITSCETITNNTKYWGNVEGDILDESEREKWISVETPRAKCKDCAYLPSCTPFKLCPNDYYDCKHRARRCYENFLLSEYSKLTQAQ